MRARLRLVPAVVALLATATACPRLDPMNTGENKLKAYQATDAGGLAMRHPPAGTIPYRSAMDPVTATGLGGEPSAPRCGPAVAVRERPLPSRWTVHTVRDTARASEVAW